jgi:hypothetical protein
MTYDLTPSPAVSVPSPQGRVARPVDLVARPVDLVGTYGRGAGVVAGLG